LKVKNFLPLHRYQLTNRFELTSNGKPLWCLVFARLRQERRASTVKVSGASPVKVSESDASPVKVSESDASPVKEPETHDHVVCRVASGAQITVLRTCSLERVLSLLTNHMPAGEDDIIMLSVTGKKPWSAITTDTQFRQVIEDLDVSFTYFRIADGDEWKSDGEDYEFDTTIFELKVSRDATAQPIFDAISEY
jgi:hypothetical protein